MKPVRELMNQNGFLKGLFSAIPCGVLIVDRERRVLAVNSVIERIFGVSDADVTGKKGGEVLRCVHADDSPEGCGFGDHCRICLVRRTARDAVRGKQIYRNRADMELLVKGRSRNVTLLVSAASFDHEGERLAVVVMEDITELSTLRARLKTEHSFAGIISQDDRMLELFETIKEIADVNIPVLIQGESGTGKELVASAIHNEGQRSSEPFVPVNCGALPEGLLESELFGHVKGAFTGAVKEKKGRFELAHRGTLFLDEIGDMPKSVQVKLLRVLQEGTFERVGGEQTLYADVRLISAANRDLKKEVSNGNFRDDLFYRVNVVPVFLPPLRERKQDIPLLVEHFLKTARDQGQRSGGISKDAMAIMIDYHWPGNIRELQSAIRFALVKSRGRMIHPEHLPLELKSDENPVQSRGPKRKLSGPNVSRALVQSGGNKAKAARILGVGRATLYRFLSDRPDLISS
ncbi:MAG: sigma 54-interacting transcriptional regulator [Deltaproteobacteria bacterium]|nr:sigma 54-interacting transcriptional regulator [Deltaproteobacteria bacterium]